MKNNSRMMLKRIMLLLFITLISQQTFSQNFEITSPDKNITLKVTVANNISWSASLKGNEIIKEAKIAMDFSSGEDFGVKPQVTHHTVKSFSTMIYPGVPHKDAEIKDEYTEIALTFKGKYQLHIRAYNDGVAYQFLDEGNRDRDVNSEQIQVTFPVGAKSFFPQESTMYSHNERAYLNKNISDISSNEFCSLPVVFTTDKAKVLLTETALHDYPGMFVRGNGNTSVDAIFPKYVLEAVDAQSQGDRDQVITKEANYIAKVSGKRAYPWRVFIISDDDRTFVESNLTYQLARPQAIENTEWIKSGKVAWDWYNANNIYGVDFKSGLNTATYKYYIDFASSNHIEYVILDEGWTKSTMEILDFNPDIDVPELIRYAKEKDVDIILWALWKPLDANLKEILETYKSWGVKGVKIDFIQRNDQYVVNSYERIAKECARLELLVDFHGSFKPSGLRRVYPNVINYEGVKGSENNKWSKDITPEHNVTIPFIRMAAGPMDYTPGAMSNAQRQNFAVKGKRPMSMGTRAHQVAMYVVYEAPLQMLCDSPSRYYKEQETVDFITQIPTTWDETVVLHGAIGDYIAVARRNGDTWYVGAMTDWSSRQLELDLSFLKAGDYKMEVFKDGVNANRFAEDYTVETLDVNQTSKVTADMSHGGGWSAIISMKKD
ncbi:glycoside hydrolase family 97 protein [Formosa sp. 4Alg 33]|uniref:glycoside hydrolase family 97 protein n=1 Tax=Formosa sp. 4Alg 33 TaxID=3382189 RepID=UPI003D9C67E8